MSRCLLNFILKQIFQRHSNLINGLGLDIRCTHDIKCGIDGEDPGKDNLNDKNSGGIAM